MPSPFPYSHVIRECSWKKTLIEKKFFFVFALACTAKSFPIAILVFFVSFLFFFFLLVAFSRHTGRSCLPMNYRSLSTNQVNRIGLVFFNTLANIFVYVLLIFISDADGQYLFTMRMEFRTRLESVYHDVLVKQQFLSEVDGCNSCNYYKDYFWLFH